MLPFPGPCVCGALNKRLAFLPVLFDLQLPHRMLTLLIHPSRGHKGESFKDGSGIEMYFSLQLKSLVLKIDFKIRFPRGGMLAALRTVYPACMEPWFPAAALQKPGALANVGEVNPWAVGAGKAEVRGHLQMRRFLRLTSASESKNRVTVRVHDGEPLVFSRESGRSVWDDWVNIWL